MMTVRSSLPLVVPDMMDPQLRWKPLSQSFPRPSPIWQSWLIDQGSLTKLLIAKSNQNFKVQVLEETWVNGRESAFTGRLHSSVARQSMWSRKVVLKGHNQPWVMAHTLVPRCSLASPLKRIKTLQSKPLGGFLFSHPHMKRSRLDVCQMGESCWGRRSLFVLYGQPILVAEYFLPQLLED
ncbi:MAG: chorismate--pyruvate lyase [SAR86 cluster bacterium]|uniref:Probable chorismate pyruvate-lyase n=1 Tax=SAR86 cluster bacterium TaxID=2030880 RepID=A0A2A4MF87_9GAMM|nr:MAG: chorismate--pyruvate lyase [SAR86 cluster bacterium]